MLCVTHRRHRSTPITDIGTRDKLYLYQMEALIAPIKGFSRYEKGLQSVTKQRSVGNWFRRIFGKIEITSSLLPSWNALYIGVSEEKGRRGLFFGFSYGQIMLFENTTVRIFIPPVVFPNSIILFENKICLLWVIFCLSMWVWWWTVLFLQVFQPRNL